MRNIIICVLLATITITGLNAQTPGELTVSVTTSEAGGKYSPRNVLAIWVSKEDGQFVKTLLAYADKRITHLNTWQLATASAGSEYNRVDAITGATQSGHATRTCKWNGTDHNGAAVPDGKYLVQMELTDKNSTGNITSFQFTKSESQEELSPENKPSFSSVAINWTPESNVNVDVNLADINYVVFPNPGNGVYQVSGHNIKELEIRSITGKLIDQSHTSEIDISSRENGVYLLYITSDQGTVVQKIIKR